MRAWIRIAGVVAIAVVASGAIAASPAASPPVVSAAPATTLRDTVERYWQESLALDPVNATFLGDHRYDAELPVDISTVHLARRYALERRTLQAIKALDPATLSPADRLSYEVFRGDRELSIEGFRYQSELLPVNQYGGLPQLLAQLGSGQSAQPFATTADYDHWLARLGGFGAWVDQAIENMRRGADKGYVQPRVLIERLLPQLGKLIAADPDQSLFLQPVRSFPAAVPERDRVRLKAAFRDAVVRELNPAYTRLRDYLHDQYLPRTRASVGWSELPLGREWYAYEVRRWTTTRLTPEEVHQKGLAEVRRLGADLDRLIADTGFKGERRAFLDGLRTDPRFYFDKEEDLLAAYADLKARVRARLPEQFDVLPKADFEIRAVEAFRAQARASASYEPPSPDGRRPGVFYVNTYDLKSRPRYAMQSIYLHEAEPGHHFQIAIQQELTGLPSFRRFGDYGAFIEGWGLYAESLGAQLGLYTDPYDRIGALSNEMWRAVRLVVDTGLHAKGWTRQQAVDYLLANTAVGETDANAEIDRYIARPGQALTYKIGELKFRELRARAERELGARFDVRAFHHELLCDGALPLEALEAKIGRWIAVERSKP